MKKLVIIQLLWILFYFHSKAQNIPLRYRQNIVFLSQINELDEKKNLGTGFFVVLIEPPAVYFYLVTAKHVIIDTATKLPFQILDITYNKIDQTRDSMLINLFTTGKHKNVFYHDDSSVDLAVIPLLPKFENSELKPIFDGELFKSKANLDTAYIKPGTNIFYTGMFSPYIGYNRNYPITRFGKVALITDEKIQFDTSEPKSMLILAETTSFGGNSGSPVYAYGSDYKINSHDSSDLINSREQNNVPISLLGVMKGYFQESNSIQFVNSSIGTPKYSNNIGVAAIIPSYFLYEIFESPELKQNRNTNLQNKIPLK